MYHTILNWVHVDEHWNLYSYELGKIRTELLLGVNTGLFIAHNTV